MCVVSMVHDYYQPRIPDRAWPIQPLEPFIPWVQPKEVDPLQTLPPRDYLDLIEKLLKDFKVAVKAAEQVDALTAQPDCVDPEKAKLIERVATLEKEIAALKRSVSRHKRTTKKV